LEDEVLLSKARAAKNGDRFRALFDEGDLSGYHSQSEADLALCDRLTFWTNGDTVRIDQLFRRSALFRPKWDERHFADGRTYGAATIEKTMAGARDGYGQATPSTNGHHPPREASSDSGTPSHSGNDDRASTAGPEVESPKTDLANARRLVRLAKGNLHYCHPGKQWLYWDGRRWAPDETDAVERLAKRAVRGIYSEASRGRSRGFRGRARARRWSRAGGGGRCR
jgi:putative DNA primase/helicase